MNWEKIDHRMKKALSEERYRHTLGVVKTAVEMAERYGEDTEKARLAAYLHDCAKCLTLDEMKKAAKDLPHDPLAETSKALMHAAAGMCVDKVAACASLYSNGNTTCTFDNAGRITNGASCGLTTLLQFIDTVDDARIAEGCGVAGEN